MLGPASNRKREQPKIHRNAPLPSVDVSKIPLQSAVVAPTTATYPIHANLPRMDRVGEVSVAERREGAPEFDDEFRQRLYDLLRWRRDVRRFKRAPLSAGTIERLIGIACLSPSVGLSEPWRFVIVEDEARRALIRQCFEACNKDALEMQTPDRAALYARLKLAGLDDAPCQLAVFSDRSTAQGAGLGRLTMPETLDYSVVNAVHTLWLAARAEGIGLGWVSILDSGAHRRDSRRAARVGVHRPSVHRLSAQGRRHAGAGAGRVGASPRPRRRRAVSLSELAALALRQSGTKPVFQSQDLRLARTRPAMTSAGLYPRTNSRAANLAYNALTSSS